MDSVVKLSKTAIWIINGSQDIKKELTETVLKVSKPTMWRYLKENDPTLTQENVISFLMSKTKLKRDQILEREPATAA